MIETLSKLLNAWRALLAREEDVWRESAGLEREIPESEPSACETRAAGTQAGAGLNPGAGTPDLLSLVQQRQAESENQSD